VLIGGPRLPGHLKAEGVSRALGRWIRTRSNARGRLPQLDGDGGESKGWERAMVGELTGGDGERRRGV
jgi:hypothetical protein